MSEPREVELAYCTNCGTIVVWTTHKEEYEMCAACKRDAPFKLLDITTGPFAGCIVRDVGEAIS